MDDIFKNLPASAEEYIKRVIKKMRYRKKIRADVRAELIAHFEDALTDCKTDEEKETVAKELITNFGDAKILGKMARRAKKRCRPLWAKTIIRSFQATCLAAFLLAAYVGWFLSGRPNVTVDYIAELNRIVKPAGAEESQNSAVYYVKAAEMYEEFDGDTKKPLGDKLKTGYSDCNQMDREFVNNWIADNSEILDLVKQGSERSQFWREYNSPDDGSMMGVLMPNLAAFRDFVRIVSWRAQLFADNEEYELAVDNVEMAYRFGQHVKSSPFLVGQLVAWAMGNYANDTCRSIVSQNDIPIKQVKKLRQDLKAIYKDMKFTVDFKTEKLFFYDEIQRSFTEGILGGGHIYPKRFFIILGMGMNREKGDCFAKALSTSFKVLFTHDNRQQTLAKVEQMYNYYDEISLLSPAVQKKEQVDIDEKLRQIADGNYFMNVLIPAMQKVTELSFRYKADVEATYTVLALLVYKADKGSYPESLSVLKEAGCINSVPIDPYSDEPLVYRRTDEGFTLYSFGSDFDDDGGKVGVDKKGKPKMWNTDDGDAVFWPVEK
ncbi:MAG: hypothetical protein K8R02_09625 [Anaerohalosphaeraceae bacterium]|nr:hypothetical protein [Anaerohalosphaeraceae bacterium]